MEEPTIEDMEEPPIEKEEPPIDMEEPPIDTEGERTDPIVHVADRPERGRCAVATADLNAGTIPSRFSGAPYAACPLPCHRTRVCYRCMKPAFGERTLRRCSRCKWARYCSTTCQKRDWASHSHECVVVQTAAAAPLDQINDAAAADVLLAARCLWRRHTSLVKDKTTEADLAFDAMEPGVVSEGDVALGRLAADVPGLLPPLDEPATAVAILIASFARNNFGVLSELLSLVGAGCYPDAALLNHSCAPNCVLAFAGNVLEVRAIRAIKGGEELTHSYTDLCQPTATRREILRAQYGFVCDCSRCVNGVKTKAEGLDVDSLLVRDAMRAVPPSASPSAPEGGGGAKEDRPAQLRLSTELIVAAAQEYDDANAELAMLRKAVRLRRRLCHSLSGARYEAECALLTAALAAGEMDEARISCAAAVRFLEMAFSHVKNHPLLALQRFTLSDLELAVADKAAAAEKARASQASQAFTQQAGAQSTPGQDSSAEAADVSDMAVDETGDAKQQESVDVEDGGAKPASWHVALQVMRECLRGLELGCASESALRKMASSRLFELRRRAELELVSPGRRASMIYQAKNQTIKAWPREPGENPYPKTEDVLQWETEPIPNRTYYDQKAEEELKRRNPQERERDSSASAQPSEPSPEEPLGPLGDQPANQELKGRNPREREKAPSQPTSGAEHDVSQTPMGGFRWVNDTSKDATRLWCEDEYDNDHAMEEVRMRISNSAIR